MSMRSLALFCALLLAGCTNHTSSDRFLTKYADPDPSLEAVLVCHGYGCHRQDTVDLRLAWPRLIAAMAEPAPDAATERANIAVTIGAFESEVGARIGTAEDVGGTFEGFAMPGQLDCIDETSNTTTVLELLDGAGLLVWHEVRGPMSRFFVYDGWPHTTAVIVETATGEAYAVDSWFHDNGQPAEVVPLEQWVAGWGPEEPAITVAGEENGEEAAIADAMPDASVEEAQAAEPAAPSPEAEVAEAALAEAVTETTVPRTTTLSMAPVVSEGEMVEDAVTEAVADTAAETVAPIEPAAPQSTSLSMAPVVSEGDPMDEDATGTVNQP